MNRTPDPPELLERLKTMGATFRLRRSGQVHTLDLSACEPAADDTLLGALEPLQSLEICDLSGAHITDEGIEALRHHTRLKLLTLTDTRITPAGLRQLRQNLIGCRIVAQ